jgi:hypothetical protein
VPRLGVRGGSLFFFCSYSLVISRRWVLGVGKAALVYFVAAMQSGGSRSELWFLCARRSVLSIMESTTRWVTISFRS